MLDNEKVQTLINNSVRQKGGLYRSRQVSSAVYILVNEINKELRKKENRKVKKKKRG